MEYTRIEFILLLAIVVVIFLDRFLNNTFDWYSKNKKNKNQSIHLYNNNNIIYYCFILAKIIQP